MARGVSRVSEKTPYHLLNGVVPLTDDLFNRMLGLVVENLSQPLSQCRPERPFKSKDHVDESKLFYPEKAVECIDVSWCRDQIVERDARLEFNRLLNLWAEHSNRDANTWDTALLRRVEIPENARQRIKDLLSVSAYRHGVLELAKDQEAKEVTLGVITGFITCADMKVNQNTEKDKGVGAGTSISAETATGIPGAIAKVGASYKKTRARTITGTYVDEVVIACCYLPLIVNLEPKSSGGLFTLPFLRGKPPPSPQVGSDAIAVHGDEGADGSMPSEATFRVNPDRIKGNLQLPLGSDESSHKGNTDIDTSLLEDEDDLAFTIDMAISMEELECE